MFVYIFQNYHSTNSAGGCSGVVFSNWFKPKTEFWMRHDTKNSLISTDFCRTYYYHDYGYISKAGCISSPACASEVTSRKFWQSRIPVMIFLLLQERVAEDTAALRHRRGLYPHTWIIAWGHRFLLESAEVVATPVFQRDLKVAYGP